MKFNKTITHAELLELLDYNPESGHFFWIKRRGSKVAGSKAGTPQSKGYISIVVNGVHYLSHRLAWFYMTSEWPNSCLDHINGNMADSRIVNLREATHSQNAQNQILSARSTSGVKGVVFHKMSQKWQVRVYENGKRRHVGIFATQKEAAEAYAKAAQEAYGQFFNAGA